MDTVVVTGGNGQIGSALLSALDEPIWLLPPVTATVSMKKDERGRPKNYGSNEMKPSAWAANVAAFLPNESAYRTSSVMTVSGRSTA